MTHLDFPGAITRLHLLAGWLGFLAGALSGALLGLRFHRDDWLGGYGSFQRRLLRLGHIAFFGLGFVNFVFAFTVKTVGLDGLLLLGASAALLTGAISMPLVCFLSAWRAGCRRLFFVPVGSLLAGIACVLSNWLPAL